MQAAGYKLLQYYNWYGRSLIIVEDVLTKLHSVFLIHLELFHSQLFVGQVAEVEYLAHTYQKSK